MFGTKFDFIKKFETFIKHFSPPAPTPAPTLKQNWHLTSQMTARDSAALSKRLSLSKFISIFSTVLKSVPMTKLFPYVDNVVIVVVRSSWLPEAT